MKRLVLLILFLISVSSFAQKADSTQLKAVIEDFFGVFSEYDIKYLERTTTPEFELYDVGEVWNADSVRVILKKGKKPFKRENKFDFLKFNIRKNVAWVSYWNTATIHRADGTKFNIRWLESAIFEKRKGRWLIAQLHSTRMK
jgi:ketosteroid isomerase-like protein